MLLPITFLLRPDPGKFMNKEKTELSTPDYSKANPDMVERRTRIEPDKPQFFDPIGVSFKLGKLPLIGFRCLKDSDLF